MLLPVLGRQQHRVEVPTLLLWGDSDAALGTNLLDGLEPYVSNPQVQRSTS